MRRIVVGYDGSPSAKAALEWAAEEARIHHAALEVLTLAEPALGVRGGGGGDAGVSDRMRAAAVAVVPDQVADVTVASGDPAEMLCAACASSDLLVVGSRGRGGFAGLVLGSVSRTCLRHARCSVAVVRGGRPAR